MSDNLAWSQHAVDTLERLDRRTRESLFRAADGFASSGLGDVTRVCEGSEFRLRAGKWRLLLTLDGDVVRIHQITLGGVAYHRGSA